MTKDKIIYLTDGTSLWDSESRTSVYVKELTDGVESQGGNLYYNHYDSTVYMGATPDGNELHIYRMENGKMELIFDSNKVFMLERMGVYGTRYGICGMFSDGTMVYMEDSERILLLDLKNEDLLGWIDVKDIKDMVPIVLNDTLYMVAKDGYREIDFSGNTVRSIPFAFSGDIGGFPKRRVCSDGSCAYFTQDDKIWCFDGMQVSEYLDLKTVKNFTRIDSDFLAIRGEEIFY